VSVTLGRERGATWRRIGSLHRSDCGAKIRLRKVVLRNGIALFRLRLQLGEGRAGVLLSLWRSVNRHKLNRHKRGGEKQQPCKQRIVPAQVQVMVVPFVDAKVISVRETLLAGYQF